MGLRLLLPRVIACCVIVAFVKGNAPATGNFGISTSSCFLDNVLYNPPKLSTYLAEAGRGATLDISIDGAPPIPLQSLFSSSVAVFPECNFRSTLSPGVSLHWRAFAPLSPEVAEFGFLPLLLGSIRLDVLPPAPPVVRNVTLFYRFFCGSDEGARAACSASSEAGYAWLPSPFYGAVNLSAGPLFVGAAGGAAAGADCSSGHSAAGQTHPALCAKLTLLAEPWTTGFESGLIFVGHYVPEGRYARGLKSPLELAMYGVSNYENLAAHHAAMLACLPSTGWPIIDAGMRSWLQSPILLTKGVGARVLTMGYVELNARDSFWTTVGLHAVFWPDLEKLMLTESCEFACTAGGGPPSYCSAADHGKIPTCVLPTIVRDDNIDITAFWALRLGRYVAATGDFSTLHSLYPCLRAALHYLQRRCAPGERLPAAREQSYWGSWLDVPFMKGRKLAADNSAVYLAAQRVGSYAARQLATVIAENMMASVTGNRSGLSVEELNADIMNFSAAFSAGQRQIVAPTSEGGQWNPASGSLSDTWWDGRAVNYTLGDQFMSVYFNVLGTPLTESLLDWITGPSGLEGPFGIRALFPYVLHAADPWGGEYAPGVYANGGSYAWLTCGTVLALASAGRHADAWRIWLKLTTRMFEPGAGGLAYEYLHSDTGARMGNAPQGWDGVCAAWAWAGGSVVWWRESEVSDVGRRGASKLARREQAPKDILSNEAPISSQHIYHLGLPAFDHLSVGPREPRRPLLLPVLSLQGSFARCTFPNGDWHVPPSHCAVVSGISQESANGEISWQKTHPCVYTAGIFHCAMSPELNVQVILGGKTSRDSEAE